MANDRFTDNGDGTVTDNQHELTWMQTPRPIKNQLSGAQYCDALDLGGYDDWRLPKIRESISLFNRSRINPTAYTDFFDSSTHDEWTISVDWRAKMDNRWVVNFDYGSARTTNQWDTDNDVRCVRGENPFHDDPSALFEEFNDTSVLNIENGLLWEVDDGTAYTYNEAVAYAASVGGRLPTIEELESIINYRGWNPAVASPFLGKITPIGYWSSSFVNWVSHNWYAWSVDMRGGWTQHLHKSTKLHVMVVYDDGAFVEPEPTQECPEPVVCPEPEPARECPLDDAASLGSGSTLDKIHLKQSADGSGDNTIDVKVTYDSPIDFAELADADLLDEVEIQVILRFGDKTYYTTGEALIRYQQNKNWDMIKAE